MTFKSKLNEVSAKRENVSNSVSNIVKQERSGDGDVFTTEEESNTNTPPRIETVDNK